MTILCTGNWDQAYFHFGKDLHVVGNLYFTDREMLELGYNLIDDPKYAWFTNDQSVFIGVRASIAEGARAADSVDIRYYGQDGLEVLKLGERGEVLPEWPKGMFDGYLEGISRIGRARRVKEP